MSIKKLLLRVARSVLNEVLGQVNAQMSILQDAVRAPIQAMIGQVTSGVWILSLIHISEPTRPY